MLARCFLSVLTVWMFTGCGGAQSDTGSMLDESDVDLGAPGNASNAQNSSDGSDSNGQTDETALKAKQYCEKEVAASQGAPVEMLDKKQISACLISLRPDIQKDCAKGVKREIILKIIIGKDGSVVGAFPVGDGADSQEAACVADKVKPVKFPMFTAKEQIIIEKFPFDIEP